MPRSAPRLVLAALVGALIAIPISVYAAHSFTDVPDDNTFHDDIAWLADVGVTKGCNPPVNSEFCPEREVTRGQMAAFTHRFAEYLLPTSNFAFGSEWGDTSRPTEKRMAAAVELKSQGTVLAFGGARFSATTSEANCWLVWQRAPFDPNGGVKMSGSERVVPPGDHDAISCQTSGAIALDPGAYYVHLVVDGGMGATLGAGSLQVLAVPFH
jgi:hypothetical protein